MADSSTAKERKTYFAITLGHQEGEGAHRFAIGLFIGRLFDCIDGEDQERIKSNLPIPYFPTVGLVPTIMYL
jgi:hypothetical protein